MAEERPVCRRCKKKRPVDEPLETARYRTCKPCREIERKKKRLKKLESLGKSTGNIVNVSNGDAHAHAHAHGHVQQHEDIQKNTYQDDSILNIANQVHRHLPPHIQQYDQQQQQLPPVLAPIQQQQGKKNHQQDDRDIPIDEILLKESAAVAALAGDNSASNSAAVAAAAVAAASGNADSGVHDSNARTIPRPNQSRNLTEEQVHEQQRLAERAVKLLEKQGGGDDDDRTDETNLFAAIRNAQAAEDAHNESNNLNTTKLKEDNVCLYCGAARSIDDNGRYQLCGNCVDNPLRTDNVYDDFEAFLNKVELGHLNDLENVIFIRKIQDGSISDFKQDAEGNNNLEVIKTQLTETYINRVFEIAGYKFSRTSSNFSKIQPKTIKLMFKCRQDIKTSQKQSNNEISVNPAVVNSKRLKTEDCRSNVYISYEIFAKQLSIKYNHKSHKPIYKRGYSEILIDKVKELEGPNVDLTDVFDYLKDNNFLNAIRDERLKVEIGELKRAEFVRDFRNFRKW